VIPVIIAATVTIPKSLRQYLSNIAGKHEIKELQKTAILGTAHTHTTVSANVKIHNIFHGAKYVTLHVAKTVNTE
jgi:hypothetical protein